MVTTGEGRRLIVRVLWGPLSSRKAVIKPGQVLLVGRGGAAGLSILHDEGMSEAHFELAWDGKRCQFRDLDSATGTLLDGSQTRIGEVSNGGWIRAGTTDFSVCFEASPSRQVGVFASDGAAFQYAEVLDVLSAQEAPLFAVLDAARDPRILKLLRESTAEYRSLYEGPQGDALAEVAPYLVSLPRDSILLDALLREGWNRSWGIYLTCPLPFLEVRRHFRKFLMVEAEGMDRRLYFRFYDPRVLGVFLTTCPMEQRKEILGPLILLAFETENGAIQSIVNEP